jgi:hypothetical protein
MTARGCGVTNRDQDDKERRRTPRWVKIFLIFGAIVVGVFAVLHLSGGGFGHGVH